MINLTEYEFISNNIIYGHWAMCRAFTKHWGSGKIFQRITKVFDEPDVAFGKTDNIPENIFFVDKNNGYDWIKLPFEDNKFKFGYWDPPYDKMYKKEGQEIWRTCKRLAILHILIYPISWFNNAKREAMICVNYGPLKKVRCLQIFKKEN